MSIDDRRNSTQAQLSIWRINNFKRSGRCAADERNLFHMRPPPMAGHGVTRARLRGELCHDFLRECAANSMALIEPNRENARV
jgi:hypothetical protein